MVYESSFEQFLKNEKREKEMNEIKSRVLPWSSQVMVNMATRPRDTTPSPIYIWYETENQKRKQGLRNEIDINEIKAANRGVINKWSEKVKKHPESFAALINGDVFEWRDIISL